MTGQQRRSRAGVGGESPLQRLVVSGQPPASRLPAGCRQPRQAGSGKPVAGRRELTVSRIGKKITPIPKALEVNVTPGFVEGQGPKGKLLQRLPPGIAFSQSPASRAHRRRRSRRRRASGGPPTAWPAALAAERGQGRHRRLLARSLDIVGVRLPAPAVEGKRRSCSPSATRTPWCFDIPDGIEIAVDKQTHVTVISGIDRQHVGPGRRRHPRGLRKPDPVQAEGRSATPARS